MKSKANKKLATIYNVDKKSSDANETQRSRAVTHQSNNCARCCLTSVIGREPVFSTWYGC